MRDFRDAKAMAQTLRDALAARSVTLTHSESLELVARLLGCRDWNVLSARILAHAEPSVRAPAAPLSADAHLPVVPVRDVVFFPQTVAPVFIGRDKSKRALAHAMMNDRLIVIVTQKRPADELLGADTLYGVGVEAEVIDVTQLGDGNIRATVKILQRAAITTFLDGDFLAAAVAPVEETRGDAPEAFELADKVVAQWEAYVRISLSLPEAAYPSLSHFRKPGTVADSVAAGLRMEISQRQDLLETGDVVARLEKLLAIVTSDRHAA